jgi:hypothetical protein
MNNEDTEFTCDEVLSFLAASKAIVVAAVLGTFGLVILIAAF